MEVKFLQDEPMLICRSIEMVRFMSLPGGSDSIDPLDGRRLEKGKIWDARLVRMFVRMFVPRRRRGGGIYEAPIRESHLPKAQFLTHSPGHPCIHPWTLMPTS